MPSCGTPLSELDGTIAEVARLRGARTLEPGALALMQFPVAEGTITGAQGATIGRLRDRHPNATWHFNDCGCCVCVHPEGDIASGYVVNDEGRAELRDG